MTTTAGCVPASKDSSSVRVVSKVVKRTSPVAWSRMQATHLYLPRSMARMALLVEAVPVDAVFVMVFMLQAPRGGCGVCLRGKHSDYHAPTACMDSFGASRWLLLMPQRTVSRARELLESPRPSSRYKGMEILAELGQRQLLLEYALRETVLGVVEVAAETLFPEPTELLIHTLRLSRGINANLRIRYHVIA